MLDLDELPIAMQMRILRMVAGISAVEMAQRWEMSPAYVYRVERGEILPRALEIRDAREAAANTYARAMSRALEGMISEQGASAEADIQEAGTAAREAGALADHAERKDEPPLDGDDVQPDQSG